LLPGRFKQSEKWVVAPMNDSCLLVEENRRLRAELQQARSEIRVLRIDATTDELTGLLNRRAFLLLADKELHLARAGGRPLTLIYIDVDGLKQINDEYGYERGNLLLTETARLLRRVFRDTDIVARFSGDEFVVLSRDFFGDSSVVSRRLDDVGAEWYRLGEQTQRIPLEVGVIVIDPCAPERAEGFLKRADSAMYSVKSDRAQFTRRTDMTMPQ
jgi:diguanylate cyclase (GGDEF)-like protein